MAYTKNTWATDDIITADKLNNLENGVNQTYYPVSVTTKDVNSLTTPGMYGVNSDFANIPARLPNGGVLEMVQYDATVGYQKLIARDSNALSSKMTTWVRLKYGSTFGAWEALAKDAEAVKLTGDQTVAGNKSFTGKTTIANKGMTDTGWLDITLESKVTAVYAKYRILFGVVYIHVQQISGKAVLTPYFTLPEGIRPPDTIFQTWFSGGKFGNNQLQPDGKFMCASGESDASIAVSFYTQYPI